MSVYEWWHTFTREPNISIDILEDTANFVKQFEGFSEQAYQCPAGVWTIGYGTTRAITPNMKITEREATGLLKDDLVRCNMTLKTLCREPLTINQTIALLDFIYNLGSGAFERSTLRMKLNRRDYEAAATQFQLWNKARVNGVLITLKGLTKRRQAEYELFSKK